MPVTHYDDHPRIPIILALMRELSLASSPREVMAAMARHYWKIRPMDYMISLSTAGLEPGEYRVTRQIDVGLVRAGKAQVAVSEPWLNPGAIPVHTGGWLGGLIADPRPRTFSDLNVQRDPVLGDAIAAYRSAMVVPLFHDGKPRYWNITLQRDAGGYAPEVMEQSLIVGNLIGISNTRLLLHEQVRTLNQALQREFEDVARVQRSLLPARTPDIPGLEVATSYLTSEQAGGDYYDFLRFDDGTWGIMIADVSGHGAAAATVMAMLHTILHAYTGSDRTPEAVIRYVNARLAAANIERSFVTAFFGVYDPRTATLSYARAGHNPPRLKSGSSGDVRVLDGAGTLPLGIFADLAPECETVTLQDRDTIVLYTDGVTEEFSPAREMFGVKRLDQALAGCSGEPQCVIDSIHGALYAHTGSRGRSDDQTLVVLRYHAGRGAR